MPFIMHSVMLPSKSFRMISHRIKFREPDEKLTELTFRFDALNSFLKNGEHMSNSSHILPFSLLSAFARYPNGIIVHYYCCKDRRICPTDLER